MNWKTYGLYFLRKPYVCGRLLWKNVREKWMVFFKTALATLKITTICLKNDSPHHQSSVKYHNAYTNFNDSFLVKY